MTFSYCIYFVDNFILFHSGEGNFLDSDLLFIKDLRLLFVQLESHGYV